MTHYHHLNSTDKIGDSIIRAWGLTPLSYRFLYTFERGERFPLILPDATAYGDYFGYASDRANQEELTEALDEIEEARGIDLYRIVHERGGSHTLVLYPRALAFPEIRELLEALESHPVLDDDRTQRIEEELRAEQWDQIIREDFRAELAGLMPETWGTETSQETPQDLPSLNPLDYPGSGWNGSSGLPWVEDDAPDADEVLEALTDDDLDELFHEGCELAGEYVEEERYGEYRWPLVDAAKALGWDAVAKRL